MGVDASNAIHCGRQDLTTRSQVMLHRPSAPLQGEPSIERAATHRWCSASALTRLIARSSRPARSCRICLQSASTPEVPVAPPSHDANGVCDKNLPLARLWTARLAAFSTVYYITGQRQ